MYCRFPQLLDQAFSLYHAQKVLCPEHTEGFSRDEHTFSLPGITYFFTCSLFGTEELLLEN